MPHFRTHSKAKTPDPDVIQVVPDVNIESFYDSELEEVPAPARKLLEGYSKVPPEDVYPLILQVREKAWSAFPYPCIGHFRFIELALPESPAYPEILDRLKKGQRFMDVGCCMGQEIRQLVADGVPAENLVGTDIKPQFFECGYNLFKDEDTLNSLFLAADILAPESVLNQMQGKIDIIWTGSFLHLFNWETQLLAMKHILKLLKPNPDGLVVGRLMGNSTAGEYSHPSAPQKTMYRHDAQSFKKLFHAAADSFGEKWETDVLAAPFEDHMKITKLQEQTPEGTLSVKFVARKLARVDVATSHNFNF